MECPLCSRSYPVDTIEAHAAVCSGKDGDVNDAHPSSEISGCHRGGPGTHAGAGTADGDPGGSGGGRGGGNDASSDHDSVAASASASAAAAAGDAPAAAAIPIASTSGGDGDVFIGTAGYNFNHWRKGAFYPRGLQQASELKHYSGVLSAVEINASFHGVPREETLRGWAANAKTGFRFALKAPQDITHVARLVAADSAIKFFFERVQTCLGPDALGPVLFQLPPSLPKVRRVRKHYRCLSGLNILAISACGGTWANEWPMSLLANVLSTPC
jgi:hypothetical protein